MVELSEKLVGLFTLVIVAVLYFLPSMAARSRGHHNTAAIFVLNLFLGWTFIGWVVALVWAYTRPKSEA